ncbi:hypothetical protein [Oceanicella actignis]|uniref:hypothetical protein n=1 Tax=Oceanicella actignis TaxID=1189325 RepID=UPI0011E73840|nr:hypothetical protein [Oceanicella actignis]
MQAKAVERLFARFDAHLRAAGHLAMSGQIVDASIVASPRQRVTEDERAIVKGGGAPEDWKKKPAQLAQKDRVTRAGRSSAAGASAAGRQSDGRRLSDILCSDVICQAIGKRSSNMMAN